MTIGEKIINYIFVFLILFLFSNCSFHADRYLISDNSNMMLGSLSASGIKIKLGIFSSSKENRPSITCRFAGQIKPSSGMTYPESIRDAFKKEFEAAHLYDDNSTNTLRGNLDKIQMSSTRGEWVIDMTFYLNGKKLMSIQTKNTFEASFNGQKTCRAAAREYSNTVQILVENTISHPKFKEIFRKL